MICSRGFAVAAALIEDCLKRSAPTAAAGRRIARRQPGSERPRLWRTVGWLLKHGLCGKGKAA
jgi:hypothetical protein